MLVRFALRRLREEQLPQVAGSLTFTSTLALVPLLTIVLAIFTLFPAFGELRSAIDAWFVHNLMPRAIAVTITSNLTQFADKAKGLSALGAVALMFTAAATLNMIERAFNRIWSVRSPRPLAQRLLVYWALLSLGPLLLALSVTVSTQLFAATGAGGEQPGLWGMLAYGAASLLITTGSYTLLYMVVPNRRVALRDAFWGALAAAIAFEIAKRLFGLFIRQFPTYAIIYGALAALPLFLLWVYVTWLITLLGAVLTAALPVIKYERWWHQGAPGSAFIDAMAVLRVLATSVVRTGSAQVPEKALRHQTRLGYDELGALLEPMEAAGWVGRLSRDEDGPLWRRNARQPDWVLLADATRLRLADVYRLFVFGHGGAPAGTGAAGAALARQVDQVVEQGLGQSLAEHAAAAGEGAAAKVA